MILTTKSTNTMKIIIIRTVSLCFVASLEYTGEWSWSSFILLDHRKHVRRRPYEDKGRDGSYAARSQRELGTPEAGRGKDRRWERVQSCGHPDFGFLAPRASQCPKISNPFIFLTFVEIKLHSEDMPFL